MKLHTYTDWGLTDGNQVRIFELFWFLKKPFKKTNTPHSPLPLENATFALLGIKCAFLGT